MALFKIFKGQSSQLSQVPHVQGYAYFTEDDGKLYIDISSDAGSVKGTRVAVNASIADEAKIADALKNADGTGTIDIDDIFLKNMTANVTQGGTGCEILTANALLIGNDEEPIKTVSLAATDVAVGDATNGIKGLSGVGALFSFSDKIPRFGTLPVEAGGTGRDHLTRNTLLAGDELAPVKMVTIPNQDILIGDETDVIKGINQERRMGAVYYGENRITGGGSITPQVGSLPIEVGGTNAHNKQEARKNLEVYSKDETDNKIATKTTTVAYNFTLNSSGWISMNETYASRKTPSTFIGYELSVPNLTCGDGSVPPIITCTNNKEEYNNIYEAIADPATDTIIFSISSFPTNNIDIIVIDVK